MSLVVAFLCALSANLDTACVSVAYGIKQVKLSILAQLSICTISTVGTFLSMLFGKIILKYISVYIVNILGAVTLICIGLYFIIEVFVETNEMDLILKNPDVADKDNSKTIDLKESVSLALALTINNVGVGIATSIAGVNLVSTTIFTFFVTFFALKIGFLAGNSTFMKYFGKYTPIVSGLIMMSIGIFELTM